MKEINLIIFFFIIHFTCAKLVCKNEKSEDIDWFIVLKYPSSANYFYLSSDIKTSEWQIPNFGLDSDHSMVALTLNQSYYAKELNAFNGFYNDEPSVNVEKSTGGHLKGVITFDKTSGFWLVHSTPKFPPTDKYTYPQPQTINGQSFFCISLSTKNNLKSILNQLLMMYAKSYNYHIPTDFGDDTILEGLMDKFAHNEHKPGETQNLMEIITLDGIKLQHFGKAEMFNKDLYASFIAPTLKTSLFTETWQHGEALESNCDSKYQVLNVKSLSLKKIEIDEYFDHSKWAVSANSTTPYVCIGDINRVKSQFRRGGGSLCIQNQLIWTAFRNCVAKYEKCPNVLYYSSVIQDLIKLLF